MPWRDCCQQHSVTVQFLTKGGVTPKRPDRPWVARNDFIRCQKRDPFDLGLCDQDAVKRILVDGRKQIHSYRVGASHRQFHITVLQQPPAQQSRVDAELLSPESVFDGYLPKRGGAEE